MHSRYRLLSASAHRYSSGLLESSAFCRSVQAHAPELTRYVLAVSICAQRMDLYERALVWRHHAVQTLFLLKNQYRISTAKRGSGQHEGSNRTPLGLHRVSAKIGAGQPKGTVFRSRKPVGRIGKATPRESIAHRILWLAGLEPGFNRGGRRDSFKRYIYIHGTPDESTLGRPASRGCIHVSAGDLIPLFDRIPEGTLVWIEQ